MPELVGYIVLFLAVGIGFILVHLLAGKLVRPAKPNPEKMTIYECGEPTIGSAWIQFDLRFYVVALLFVIFDVEVAFFFPWAVVFGTANTLADKNLSAERRIALTNDLVPAYPENEAERQKFAEGVKKGDAKVISENQQAARKLAWFAFIDILVFFGVLLVGFAYLWKRGDLDWVRSTAAEEVPREKVPPAPAAEQGVLVGAGHD